jgi:glycosyltransferase involved in cell wall biosynthesis
LYALHEGVYLDPNAALSVLAYTVVVAPTRAIADMYYRALSSASEARSKPKPPADKFRVLPHPVNTKMYSPSVRKYFEIYPSPSPPPQCEVVAAMVAKNNPRKDYLRLLWGVAEARKQGVPVCAGLYWVDHISQAYWKYDDLVKYVSLLSGIPAEALKQFALVLDEPNRAVGMSESQLLWLYLNAMHLHLYLTRGEAFGLPVVETALLGIPTAVNRIDVTEEVAGKHVKMLESEVCIYDHYALYCPSLKSVVDALEEFYRDPASFKPVATEELAEKVDMHRVAGELEKLLEEAMRDPKPLNNYLRLM